MDLIRQAQYGSSEEEDDDDVRANVKNASSSAPLDPAQMRARVLGKVLTSAPTVLSAASDDRRLAAYDSTSSSNSLWTADGRAKEIMRNPTASELYRPVLGPENPNRKRTLYGPDGNVLYTPGVPEPQFVDGAAYEIDRFDYQQRGYAAPHKSLRLEDETDKTAHDPRFEIAPRKRRRTRKSERRARQAAFRERVLDQSTSSIGGSACPWIECDAPKRPKSDYEAGRMTEAQKEARKEALAKKGIEAEEDTAASKDEADRKDAFKYTRGEGPAVPWKKSISADAVKSIFHGDAETDYQGRSWVDPPSRLAEGVDDDDFSQKKAFIPKKCIHTWSGHTKGVRKIELFPKFGHLLLSGSFDSKIKIWDVHNKRRCMRTYMGHSAGVNDVNFSNDGDCFVSSSLDRHIKLWDTETGKCRIDMSNNKVPYCVRFYPENNNLVLMGCSNKKTVQFDLRTGEVVQEYDHHLGPVNSVLFIDDNRRFVTTSDDKKMMIWDFNVPVPIKYISDPTMHSIPTMALRPCGKYYVGQSLDNQILSYQCGGGRIKPHKKRFSGHIVAGFACQPNFSPNGQYLMSGDGDGRLWFWDWRSTKVVRKLRAHSDGPCIGCEWHPLEPSKVVTCGWDGLIKLWN
eukprot:g1756.t1